MNPTVEKFGYPTSLLKEYEHWLVLLRPAQVTLGSLVLAVKGSSKAYGDLPRDAFCEQADAVQAIERALRQLCQYERINYLMLMMVDPDVHFHVIPRYSEPREWNGMIFADAGWPGPPQLGEAVHLSTEQIGALATELSLIFR